MKSCNVENELHGRFADMSDESLVALAKDGAHQAFSELSRRHSTTAYRTVLRIARNREDAEDALQDSLLKAFIHLGTFDGRSTFSTWLTRIAINSALMILRKQRAHPESSFDIDGWGSLQLADPSLDPERCFAKREKEHKVRAAVMRLPPLLRNVAEIRYSQDSSIGEIAEYTGVSVAAVKSRLLRARSSLRRSLNDSAPRPRPTPQRHTVETSLAS